MDLAFILQFALDFISKYPIVGVIFMYMGMSRSIFKLLFTFLQGVVDATPSTKDNEMLKKLQESKFYKGLAFVLDYLASIKLPQAK